VRKALSASPARARVSGRLLGQFVPKPSQWTTLPHLSGLAPGDAGSYRESLGLSVPSTGAPGDEEQLPPAVSCTARPPPTIHLGGPYLSPGVPRTGLWTVMRGSFLWRA
jgi:hypothetical protein